VLIPNFIDEFINLYHSKFHSKWFKHSYVLHRQKKVDRKTVHVSLLIAVFTNTIPDLLVKSKLLYI
jgi:hypothetical protein